MATVLCLAVIIDSQHRIRDDRMDSREHVVWRTRDKIMNGILVSICGLRNKLWKWETQGVEEQRAAS
jgi:hypothetical protein